MRKVHAIHGRDHAPTGMDPIPDLPIWWLSSWETVGNANTVPTATPTMLSIQGGLAGNNDVNPLQPPTVGDPYAIQITTSGLYLVQAEVQLDTPGTFYRAITIVVGADNPPTFEYDWYADLTADMQFSATQTLTFHAILELTTDRPFPLYAAIEFEQTSGGDVDALGQLTLIRVGPPTY